MNSILEDPGPKVYILRGPDIELECYAPGSTYGMTRFDWTGLVRQLRFKGHPLLGKETEGKDQDRRFGSGCCNEFGIEAPLGFAEAELGSWCPKIGVGLIQKVHAAYDFHYAYPLQPAAFAASQKERQLILECSASEHNGYAYRLTKTIELLDDGFAVHYRLRNTGQKPINTTEYTHNFVRLGNDPIGSAYRLRFPRPVQPSAFGETVNPEDAAIVEADGFAFRSAPQQPVFFSNVLGGGQAQASWTLHNHNKGLGLRESIDGPVESVNVWSNGQVLSPELFVRIAVPKGGEQTWSRLYTVVEEHTPPLA